MIPNNEYRFLLCHLLKKTKEELFFKEPNLNDDEKLILDSWIKRRKNGEPLSKIVKKKHFWEREFFINEHTLDPRQESETIIEAVLDTVGSKDDHYRILDLGTGSGCLLLTLLDEYENAIGIGIDKSQEAIKVAIKNKSDNSRAFFKIGDWANNLSGHFDIIISNPPYIAYNEDIDKSVKQFDPYMALYGGKTGLEQYELICNSIKNISYSHLFFEVGYLQSESVKNIVFKNLNIEYTKTFKDLLGFNRVLYFKSK